MTSPKSRPKQSKAKPRLSTLGRLVDTEYSVVVFGFGVIIYSVCTWAVGPGGKPKKVKELGAGRQAGRQAGQRQQAGKVGERKPSPPAFSYYYHSSCGLFFWVGAQSADSFAFGFFLFFSSSLSLSLLVRTETCSVAPIRNVSSDI